jgi:hypothetical protein
VRQVPIDEQQRECSTGELELISEEDTTLTGLLLRLMLSKFTHYKPSPLIAHV